MFIPKLDPKFIDDLHAEGLQLSLHFRPDGCGTWLKITEPSGQYRDFDASDKKFFEEAVEVIRKEYLFAEISIDVEELEDGEEGEHEYTLYLRGELICWLEYCRPGKHISNIDTLEEFQRMGYATKLLNYVLKQEKPDVVEVMVAKDNPASLGLFKKAKFRIVKDLGLGYILRRRLVRKRKKQVVV